MKEHKVRTNEEFKCSASTLNLFIKDPCLFILKHYYGLKSDYNIWAMRGTAVEAGVNHYLQNEDILGEKDAIKAAVQAALNKYYEDSFLLPDDTLDIEDMLPNWVRNSITQVKTIIRMTNRKPTLQRELDFEVEGLNYTGFLDFDFGEETVDLKTTNTLPKILVKGENKGKIEAKKADNVRQQCLYKYARNGGKTSLLYVTDTDFLLYTIPEDTYIKNLEEIKKYSRMIKEVLTNGEKWAIKKYYPNEKLIGSFYWNQEMIDKANELWK